MVDLSKEFETFYNNHVVLSRKDQNELRKKKNTNIKRLKSGLIEYNKENYTSYSVADTLVQGSMAMYTVVQNDNKDYDIDVAIIFDKDNLGNDIGAIKAKNIVCEALKKNVRNLKMIPRLKRTVLQFHIQMVIILILQCIEDIKNILGMRNIHMNMLDHSNGKKGILKQSMNGFRMK